MIPLIDIWTLAAMWMNIELAGTALQSAKCALNVSEYHSPSFLLVSISITLKESGSKSALGIMSLIHPLYMEHKNKREVIMTEITIGVWPRGKKLCVCS